MPAKKQAPETQAQLLDVNPPASFESAVLELETLVQRMDKPDVGLETLLADYKRGAYLVGFCRERLAQVKQEMNTIEQQLDGLQDDDL